jgi:asparagine synthetase B (glutamine-hydrolysing)
MMTSSEEWIAGCTLSAATPSFQVEGTGGAAAFTRGGVTAIFAGILYNRSELDEARRPPSSSDAERIVLAWSAWGESFVQKLRGLFSFVLFDAASASLLAARDPLGVYPLFTAVSGETLWFSPLLDELTRKVELRPNRELLAEHLIDAWTDVRETYFEGVQRLAPATLHRFARSGTTTSLYWDPSSDRTPLDAAGAGVEFERRLDAAVHDAMKIGTTGIFLSGGVDSISIAAVARSVSRREALPVPQALSLLYRDSEVNEEDAQREAAEMLEMPALRIALDDALHNQPPVETLLRRSGQWSTPMWNLWLPGFIELAHRGRERGCEVILTGGGGDEWLGVGPYLAADYLSRLQLGRYWRLLQNTRRSYSMPTKILLRNLVWSFGLRLVVHDLRNRIVPRLGYDLDASRARRGLPGWVAGDAALRRRVIERMTVARRAERKERSAMGSHYWAEARKSLHHPIVVMEMENKFEMGREAGVRFVEPYWDPRVVELLYRTPPDVLNAGGNAKALAHQIIRREMPAFKIPAQKKLALSDFYRARVRGEAAALWQQMKGAQVLADLGIVDAAALNARVARILEQRDSRDLWLIPHVLTVEAWVRERFA